MPRSSADKVNETMDNNQLTVSVVYVPRVLLTIYPVPVSSVALRNVNRTLHALFTVSSLIGNNWYFASSGLFVSGPLESVNTTYSMYYTVATA